MLSQHEKGLTLHDTTLRAMHESGLVDVIITMANNLDEVGGSFDVLGCIDVKLLC